MLGCVSAATETSFGLTDWVLVASAGTAIAGADPLLFVGKNLHIIGTKVGSLYDTEKALEFAARVGSIPMLSLICRLMSFRDFLSPYMRCFH